MARLALSIAALAGCASALAVNESHSAIKTLQARTVHPKVISMSHYQVNCTFYGNIAEDHFAAGAASPFGVCVTDENTPYYLPEVSVTAHMVPSAQYKLELARGGAINPAVTTTWQLRGGYVLIKAPVLLQPSKHAPHTDTFASRRRLSTEGPTAATTPTTAKVLSILLDYNGKDSDQNVHKASARYRTDDADIEAADVIASGFHAVAETISRSSNSMMKLEHAGVVAVDLDLDIASAAGCDYWDAIRPATLKALRLACKQMTGDTEDKCLGGDFLQEWKKQYGHVEFFLPTGLRCQWEGAAWMKQGQCASTDLGCQGWSWINEKSPTMSGLRVHELGHNLGLNHANGFLNGNVVTYGDDTSPMGSGTCPNCKIGSFSLPNLFSLGWCSGGDCTAQDSGMQGVSLDELGQAVKIRLAPLHGAAAGSDQNQKRGAFVSSADSDDTLFVAYRTNDLKRAGRNAVSVHVGSRAKDNGQFTLLLQELDEQNAAMEVPTQLQDQTVDWCHGVADCTIAVAMCGGHPDTGVEVAIAAGHPGNDAKMVGSAMHAAKVKCLVQQEPAGTRDSSEWMAHPVMTVEEKAQWDTVLADAYEVSGLTGAIGARMNGVYVKVDDAALSGPGTKAAAHYKMTDSGGLVWWMLPVDGGAIFIDSCKGQYGYGGIRSSWTWFGSSDKTGDAFWKVSSATGADGKKLVDFTSDAGPPVAVQAPPAPADSARTPSSADQLLQKQARDGELLPSWLENAISLHFPAEWKGSYGNCA